MMDEGPLEGEDIRKGVEGCQIEGITMIEVTLEEEDPLIMENPLMMEYPLMMENCLMMEDPLMMEDHLIMVNCLMTEDHLMMDDPLEMEEIQDALEDKDPQVHQDLLDLSDLL